MRPSIVGGGWSFPIRVNERGAISLSRGETDIDEAIWIILNTRPGERVMTPELGCGVHQYVFAPINDQVLAQIEERVREALVRWEPRVEVLEVRATADRAENQLLVWINYRVRSNNAMQNRVYPFYLREGGR
jgi:phage baseplate assembly protein W